ncbi:hypothetical protein U2I83_17205 [Bacillus amyloliquefaciens]|uniref:hypothetical protein n=1 Tax=Bacillus amyloliquefaciens TaxID=1390 RepID=UPI0032DF1ECE
MLVLIGVFIFSALTSPLFTYYAGDIIGNLSGSNDAKLILPDPHWHELIASYFKNSSQLVMLICAYLVADMCAFGKDKSLQHFYKSRGENAWIVFWPKVLVSVAITFIGTVVGSIFASYETWVFFDDLDFGNLIAAFALQIFGFLLFVIVSVTISIWLNSPFVSALIVTMIVFISSFLKDVHQFKNWSPTTFLSPTDVLKNGIEFDAFGYSMIISILTLIICLVFIYIRPLRYKNR